MMDGMVSRWPISCPWRSTFTRSRTPNPSVVPSQGLIMPSLWVLQSDWTVRCLTWWCVWGCTSTLSLCEPCPVWSSLHRPPPPTAGGTHYRSSVVKGKWAPSWSCQWLSERKRQIIYVCLLLCLTLKRVKMGVHGCYCRYCYIFG